MLGVKVRENLKLPDRGLIKCQEYINKITYVIRKYQPKYIFVPYELDRHPDHGNCAALVEEAVFSAGIRKYEVEQGLQAHKVTNVFYYFINGFHQPTFIHDVSNTMNKKIESLQAYRSQFIKLENSIDTPLTNGYIDVVTSRERMFGKEVGVNFGEGFISKTPLLLGDVWLGERS